MKKVLLICCAFLLLCNICGFANHNYNEYTEIIPISDFPEWTLIGDYYFWRGETAGEVFASVDGVDIIKLDMRDNGGNIFNEGNSHLYVFADTSWDTIPRSEKYGAMGSNNSPSYIFDGKSKQVIKLEYNGYFRPEAFTDDYLYFSYVDCTETFYNEETKRLEGQEKYYAKTTNGIDFEKSTYEEIATKKKVNAYNYQITPQLINNTGFFVDDETLFVGETENAKRVVYENETATYINKLVTRRWVREKNLVNDEGNILKKFLSIDMINFYPIPADATTIIGRDKDYIYYKICNDEKNYYKIDISGFKGGQKIIYNNSYLSFENPPVLENDRTLIPMRFLFEQMGAEVSWDETTNTATVSKASDVVSFSIDNTVATVNAQPKTMDVPARLINDKTYIPLRFLSEELGYTVEWDEETNTVTISEERR